MLWAAQDLGWELFYMEPQHLYAQQGVAMGLMCELKVMRDPAHFYSLGIQQPQALGDLDVILMRKDPPFDTDFYTPLIYLARQKKQGR